MEPIAAMILLVPILLPAVKLLQIDLVYFGLVTVLALVLGLLHPKEKRMAIEKIHPAVTRITTPFDKTGTVFLYLVQGERVALIDTGAADSPDTVLQGALAEMRLSFSGVDLILNTHAHLDHAGGNLGTKRRSQAPIHVHAGDLAMAQSTEAQVEFHCGPLRALEFPMDAVAERATHVRHNAGEPAGADILLKDGDKIDLGSGVALRVIHTPGHTPGHVTFFWEAEGIAFTGDAVQGQGARPGSYPYYFDAPAYRRSLARLAAADPRMLCLGHAFHGGTLLNWPTRRGADATAFLHASQTVADTMHRAVAGVLRRLPSASKREIALAALDDLLYEVPQLRHRKTGMPLLAGPTLLAHMVAAQAGTYPES
jgi:glyoxylase-like metal-dependent hydrolase (beta-lactamase superfamily II)